MVQLTRIYTGGGDKGKTSLGTGARLLKSSPRIMAIGKVDETNAAIGVARLYATTEMQEDLSHTQHDLFDLGADLCMPDVAKLKITKNQCAWLEKRMDQMNENLAPLKSFVLPGGSASAAYLHFARTTARDAERALITLMQGESINPDTLIYLNRLSDFLFVCARQQNSLGDGDILWEPGKNQKRG